MRATQTRATQTRATRSCVTSAALAPVRAMSAALAIGLAGCASLMPQPRPAGDADIAFPLFTASGSLMEGWRMLRVWGTSHWKLVPDGGTDVAVAPLVEGSSSALVRWIDIDAEICPEVEWSWRVDELPEGADLAHRATDDVAASIFFAFGDPGPLANPAPVPTLRYVWATAANPEGSVIDSPYFSGTLRSLVVRSGPAQLGTWVTERRNLRADFETAFGKPPPEPVRVMALFTDNDHLKTPVRSFYRSAQAWCTEEPGGL
ncbi:MAG: DUF3047 domain-containing protein [Thermohalobaculum sp.]|nr:DUF3047 domain-containing protein [Thermohalobaculum sp.]